MIYIIIITGEFEFSIRSSNTIALRVPNVFSYNCRIIITTESHVYEQGKKKNVRRERNTRDRIFF